MEASATGNSQYTDSVQTPQKLSVEIFSDKKDVAIKLEQLLNSVLMVAVDLLEFKGEQALKLEHKVQ